jgi:allantoin racemase
MQLLLINPNTSSSMTDLMLGVARQVASPDVEITAVTGRFGGRYVASRATHAIAGHAALDAYAEHGANADVVLLACFGDPGLFALKEIARQPVIGMAEAACLQAAGQGRRFGIVTGGERWGPMLYEFVTALGLQEHLAVVTTVAPTGADIALDPEQALELLASACRIAVTQHGAESVILGGAGLAGLSRRIQDRVPVPLIDSVEASIAAAERLGHDSQRNPIANPLFVESVGLAPSLAKLISGY